MTKAWTGQRKAEEGGGRRGGGWHRGKGSWWETNNSVNSADECFSRGRPYWSRTGFNARLYRADRIFLLRPDSQLFARCAITGRGSAGFPRSAFVVMRGGEATVKCVASLREKMRVSGCEAQLKKGNKAFVSNHQQWNQELSLVPRVCLVTKRCWIKQLCLWCRGPSSPSSSPLSRGLDSQLIHLQILFPIKCPRKR